MNHITNSTIWKMIIQKTIIYFHKKFMIFRDQTDEPLAPVDLLTDLECQRDPAGQHLLLGAQ